EAKKIAIHDEAGFLKADFKNSEEVAYTDLSAMPLATAKEKAAEDYEGLLYVPKAASPKELLHSVQFISNDSPGMEYINSVEDVINEKLTRINLEEAGIDYKKIDSAKTDADIRLVKVSGEESLRWLNEIKIGIGFAFGYLIMMFIIIYGNMVMRSVIEEKTNRIIEIIISSVKPFQLMMGKIIGTSLAGILQFIIWAVLGLLLFFVAGNLLGLEMGTPAQQGAVEASKDGMVMMQSYINELSQLPLATMFISFLIYFIGGYFLYSSIYAAIGAAVDNETDSQQFLLPIILPLMLGVYVGFFTVIEDPHGTVATVFSMIPLTSPIVMLMRIPFGVPVWQLLLSMAILFATFFLVV
ncbi:MAG: ABC transporter permease, partial [Flavobacterium sp.]